MSKKLEQVVYFVGLCTILALAMFGLVCIGYLSFRSFFG